MLRVEPSTPVQAAEIPPSIGTKTAASDAPLADVDLDWAITTALARCGLSSAEACERMTLDPSQWSKQLKNRDNAHVSAQRLLKLPRQFWIEFLSLLADRLGIVIAHPDLADRALSQLFLSVEAAVTYARQDRALRAGGLR
jgi:hypothetical protein